tara:strand:+ start:298 stop:1260 length:963 start_codon:yes stop_codon:yes gene_type:complete
MKKKIIDFYKKISLIRIVENEISSRYNEGKMRCPVHLSTGQEASAVGICENLNISDRVYSTHRCHAHYIAKGGNVNKMIAEIYGKKTGCCQGRGGSMHLFDESAGVVASVPIVSSSIPLAAGDALAIKLKNKKNIAVAFFGDGSIEEGIFYETLNFAILKKLPLLFVCENNQYSIMTHINERQPKNFIKKFDKLYDIDTYYCDGNKIDKVFNASKQAIKKIKNGGGPGMIVLDTYRFKEHCGPGDDLKLGYRSLKEFNYWKNKDPLNYCKKIITKNFKNYKDLISKIDSENTKICNQAFKFAEKSPFPNKKDISLNVYCD